MARIFQGFHEIPQSASAVPARGTLAVSTNASPFSRVPFVGELGSLSNVEQESAYIRQELQQLKAQLAELRGIQIPARSVPIEKAAQEILGYAKSHKNEDLYPSDIAFALSLDYDIVVEAFKLLELKGGVKKA